MEKQPLYIKDFKSWTESVPLLLDACAPEKELPEGRTVLIKPNLVNSSPPPITTPVGLVEEIVKYLKRKIPGGKIIVGEGCGSKDYDTWKPFRDLGYVDMAEKYDIELADLNTHKPFVGMKNPQCRRWPEMYLPEIVMESFVISVPVLKAHSFSEVTLTMKNMMGAAPPEYYDAGSWKKSAFHHMMHEAILDLNRYRTPDFTVLDATVGMKDAHLWGDVCRPAPNIIAACADPVAIDAYGADLLGRDWRRIPHIKDADGLLGFADPLNILKL